MNILKKKLISRPIAIVSLAVVGISLLSCTQDTLALSFMRYDTPQISFEQSEVVFRGRVLVVENIPENERVGENEYKRKLVTFEVHRQWKGNEKEKLSLYQHSNKNDSNSGVEDPYPLEEFKEGQEYLIYAETGERGMLTTYSSFRTSRVADNKEENVKSGVEEDLQYLEQTIKYENGCYWSKDYKDGTAATCYSERSTPECRARDNEIETIATVKKPNPLFVGIMFFFVHPIYEHHIVEPSTISETYQEE